MAASFGDSHSIPIYGARYRLVAPLLDADGDLVTGATTPDSEVSINQGTFADCVNEAVEIATASGLYYLDLSSAEMTAKSVAVIIKSATAGMKTTPLVLYPKRMAVMRTGTAQAGAATTITLDAGAGAIDNRYRGCYVNITNNSPANALGQARRIISYVGSTKVATVEAAWGTNPSSASTFEILVPEIAGVAMWAGTEVADPHTAGYPVVTIKDGTGTGEIDTTSGGVLVAALAANAITATSIAADAITAAKVADGTIDAATFAAGAINAAAIATDAIGAAELAADAVTEIQSGLATAAALATVQADTDNIQTRLPAALVSGRMDSDVGALQSGAITAASIATDALGALELAAGAATEIAAAVWDEARAGHVTAGTFGQGVASVQGNVTGSVGSVTGSVGSVASGGIAAASFAAGAIDAAAIATDAIGSAELAASAVTEIQSGLATAASLTTAQTDLDNIQSRLPAALVSGRMDSDVGAIQAGAISAAAIATDALDADALAADAVLEIVDALLKRDMAAVTGEADRSLLNAIRFIRNKWSIAGNTLTVTKEDDTTTAWTAVVVGTAGADPITVVDPA